MPSIRNHRPGRRQGVHQTQVPSWRARALEMVGFQLGWLICVLGAAADNPWIGPLFVALLVILHLRFLPGRRVQLRLILVAAVLGAVTDGALLLLGIFSFTGAALPAWLSPIWLTAMWINFALTLHFSMSWLLGRYFLGAAMGALGGPTAYYAGARLGAVEFETSLTTSLVVVGLVWAAALPILLYWAREEESCQ